MIPFYPPVIHIFALSMQASQPHVFHNFGQGAGFPVSLFLLLYSLACQKITTTTTTTTTITIRQGWTPII